MAVSGDLVQAWRRASGVERLEIYKELQRLDLRDCTWDHTGGAFRYNHPEAMLDEWYSGGRDFPLTTETLLALYPSKAIGNPRSPHAWTYHFVCEALFFAYVASGVELSPQQETFVVSVLWNTSNKCSRGPEFAFSLRGWGSVLLAAAQSPGFKEASAWMQHQIDAHESLWRSSVFDLKCSPEGALWQRCHGPGVHP